MDKTDIPGTFNAGATLGPVNETNMARIWNKHRQTNTPLKRKVVVAMSGGVDSSVAAALLKESGFDVRGVHIKMWSDPDIPCAFKEDRYDAMRVAAYLQIPFETWDLTKEYREAVVEYMINEYKKGRTPNPDVMCNRHIKFGIFWRRALASGADYIATGHYSQKIDKENFSSIIKAVDEGKDQTYFLWAINQKAIRTTFFPIGNLNKTKVRELAGKMGLPTAAKPDSQGICFIGEIDIKNFLQKYISSERGEILTTSGARIGAHDGLSFYTIGQRHGINIGGGIPYYVADKDFQSNTLVVAEGPYDRYLFSKKILASEENWLSGIEPQFPLTAEARIRYRQPLEKCLVEKKGRLLNISFNEPQRAITPGQSIVFYLGEEMIGGAIIEKSVLST